MTRRKVQQPPSSLPRGAGLPPQPALARDAHDRGAGGGETLTATSRFHAAHGAFLVVGIALLALMVGAAWLNPSRLHISGMRSVLNDQVGYVSVARNLCDTGTLHSNIVYPATLSQNKSRDYFYMPGYYALLAASYACFGFGVYQSLLPSMVTYALSAVFVFLMGARLYGLRVGVLAAVLWIVFPPNLLFAVTAMSEMTVIAAAMFAMTAVVYAPAAWRPFVAPLLLVVPFVCREATALLVLPMAACVLYARGRRNLPAATALLVATVVLLSIVFRLDFSAGRPSLNAVQYDEATSVAKYTDATIPSRPATWSAFWQAMLGNLSRNWTRMLRLLAAPTEPEGFAFGAILSLTAVVLGYGILVLREDMMFLATGAMVTILVLAILLLYTPDSYRGLRVVLFSYPLLAVCAARLYTRFDVLGRFLARRAVTMTESTVLLLFFVWITVGAVRAVGRTFPESDAEDDAALTFVTSVGHDDRSLLVAPFSVALPYVYAHHPVRWSFLPANRETLDMLRQKYEIGTVIVADNGRETSLQSDDFRRIGLTLERRMAFRRRFYAVFQRPPR